MIRDQSLWEKVKDLLGTKDDVRRLDATNAQGRLTADDYWSIKARWVANKARERDGNGNQ